MSPPPEVLDLIERFDRNRDAYRSGAYKEAEARVEFISPLFAALGWDMANAAGSPAAYKEVVHEASLSTTGGTKAPDYAFRVGGRRKFFVEAKRPSVSVEEDVAPAFQLRRYAWTARLPLSILTDFEEFAVYDCRVTPEPGDSAAVARLIYLTYHEYADAWDELQALFGRDAVMAGSLETFAISARKKRGSAPVDEVFLDEIEAWRHSLAEGFLRLNAHLSQRELNYAVQMTIDRIVFLRMCEDRGIEPYGALRESRGTDAAYAKLITLFKHADDRYNSGLFHFEDEAGRTEGADHLTPTLRLEDGIIHAIVDRLYFPQSPYEFSVLPTEILGQVYERFLGNVIAISNGEVEVVEKPEVRKAGGVYYTPTSVVDYIVNETLGPLTEGRTARDVARLKVVDPACGSGSFLLGAYEFLLRWHRDWYVTDGIAKHRRRIYERAPDDWRLTIAERKRILLSSIFGVDIDSQAVETTKLSLLLKVLEEESSETIGENLRLFHERALPDLGDNIKSGNSLVATDFYEQTVLSLSEDERIRINPFDWQAAFPDVFERRKPGFDAVIGNPPYVFGEYLDPTTKTYLQGTYELASNQFDTYAVFVEASLRLTRDAGAFSMVIPDAVLARDLAAPTRQLLLVAGLNRVFHCGQVFDAGVSAAVVVAVKGSNGDVASDAWDGRVIVTEHTCSRERFQADAQHRLLVHASDAEAALLERLVTSHPELQEMLTISRGEELGKQYVLKEGRIPILVGEDIDRFFIRAPTRYVEAVEKDRALYDGPKLLVVKTGRRCVAAFDRDGQVTMQSLYNLQPRSEEIELEAVLGILNSRVVDFLIFKGTTAYKLLFPQLNQTTLAGLPLPMIDRDQATQLASEVRRLEDLATDYHTTVVPHDRDVLARALRATHRNIDTLVYAAYQLSDEDVAIIEEAALPLT